MTMLTCPECQSQLDTSLAGDSNAIPCHVCGRPVYLVRNPFASPVIFPAISNSDSLSVPNDILTHKIIDQSPTDAPPRNMIVGVADGDACLIVQVETNTRSRARPTRKSLEKTAVVLSRPVLWVRLPLELMERMRATQKPDSGG